jgi:hypothetical protein
MGLNHKAQQLLEKAVKKNPGNAQSGVIISSLCPPQNNSHSLRQRASPRQPRLQPRAPPLFPHRLHNRQGAAPVRPGNSSRSQPHGSVSVLVHLTTCALSSAPHATTQLHQSGCRVHHKKRVRLLVCCSSSRLRFSHELRVTGTILLCVICRGRWRSIQAAPGCKLLTNCGVWRVTDFLIPTT